MPGWYEVMKLACWLCTEAGGPRLCQSAFWNRHVDLLRYLGTGCEAMDAPSLRLQGRLMFNLGPAEVSQHR
jgi:hypothetical protein